MRIEDITEREIERWRAGIVQRAPAAASPANKTKNNLLVLLHAIFRRAVKLYGLPRNPVANVDRYRVRRSGDIEVFSPEEVWGLVRAAASETDARDLPDRRVHRPAPRRAARAALARRRLRRPPRSGSARATPPGS